MADFSLTNPCHPQRCFSLYSMNTFNLHPSSQSLPSLSFKIATFYITYQGFFSRTLKGINSNNTLSSSEVEELLTLLSATLTNPETGLNNLQETTSDFDSDLLAHLSNGTKLYSISLAFFKRDGRNPRETLRENLKEMIALCRNKSYMSL